MAVGCCDESALLMLAGCVCCCLSVLIVLCCVVRHVLAAAAAVLQVQTISGEGVLTQWQRLLKAAGVRRCGTWLCLKRSSEAMKIQPAAGCTSLGQQGLAQQALQRLALPAICVHTVRGSGCSAALRAFAPHSTL